MANQSPVEAAATLRGLANGLRTSQALFVTAKLRVADHLSKRPLTCCELATATGADAVALGRVMRALCAVGLFSESRSGHFSLEPVGQFLRSDFPGSFRAGVVFLVGPTRWRCWSELLETVMTGVSASERLLGKSIFEFYAGCPEESEIHDEAMRAFSASHAAMLLDAIDLRRDRVVVDVGGGTGECLAAILAANPGLRGILFDLPNVVERTAHVLMDRMVADRCTVEAGSFFERVPGGGDTYLLKHIVHDWDDKRARTLLQCCRRCMPSHSRLVIVERMLPERIEPGAAVETFLTDLEMLVTTPGGRERTEIEFRDLLADAGFTDLKIMPTASPLSVVEARPA
jgi:hypothetical protein